MEGLIASLNRGLVESTGEFIARMDHDDLSLPERFQLQVLPFHRPVTFLRDHPDIAVVGTQAELFSTDPPRSRTTALPTEPAEVAVEMLFSCCLVHPSIMGRRVSLQPYPSRFLHAEDYASWLALLAGSP